MNKMKKVTGWILVIVCSVFLLIFVFTIIVITMSLLENGSSAKMTPKEIISSAVGFVIVIILLIVGLMNGIKRIKKDKVEIIDYIGTLDINITGRIAYKDYRNLFLGLSFKKPIYIVLICVLILFSLSYYVNGSSELENTHSYILTFVFLGVLISPIIVLWQTKRTYQTNKAFQEELNYKFTNDSIHIKGKTVESIQKWTSFYKMKETKRFFMFYQGEGIATLLDKRMFSDNELNNFKQFIRSLNLKF